MSSKLIHSQKPFFSEMVVDAVMILDQEDLDESLIGVKKIPGGGMQVRSDYPSSVVLHSEAPSAELELTHLLLIGLPPHPRCRLQEDLQLRRIRTTTEIICGSKSAVSECRVGVEGREG